ncbi:hypothetical protein AAFF_G00392910 [Aldrovandia affinis]|uniref:Uncharacterized protein n=1 Tax=Aldrovandia affinis TaxID=143900 RepID=A0AAD7R455_9TELE|nr:hypothetical protein AAFF_G00392910 [Aldrovandia affinis]
MRLAPRAIHTSVLRHRYTFGHLRSSSEDSDFFSLKRIRREEEALQSSPAKDMIKQILLTKPGGTEVLKEYEEKGTISPGTRKVMVNILVADMVESEVKEKFSIPVDNILTVEDETGTEVDNDMFPDLLTTNGICFVIKNELNDSEPSTPQSSGTDTLSVTSRSSSEDSDFFSLKRIRREEEALQSSPAKDMIKQILLTKPGGTEVLKEYEEKGTISPGTRKVMILQDFRLLFGSETSSKLLEKWQNSFKAKVIKQADMLFLTSTPLLMRLLLSAKNQHADEPLPVKEKFSIPVDNILTVEDETGTEVDNDMFPDLLTTNGICFVIKNELNDSEPSTPQSSGTDTLSVTSRSSSEDSDFFSLKRIRREEEALQSSPAKDVSAC